MKRNEFLLVVSGCMTCGAAVAWAADHAGLAVEGLRDVKGPTDFPANYVLPLAILLALLIGGLAAYVFVKRKRKKIAEELPVDTRRPWEIAFDQLSQLEKSGSMHDGRFKEFYSELSGIIRRYFENRFQIRAPEMTTEEFLWSLERSSELKADHKETLQKFMTSCDIIKFAKHVPRIEEAHHSYQFARQLVEETKITDDT